MKSNKEILLNDISRTKDTILRLEKLKEKSIKSNPTSYNFAHKQCTHMKSVLSEMEGKLNATNN